MWRPNLPGLAGKRQVVTWDIRGHGRSASPSDPARYSEAASVADIAAILDACGIRRAAIGGLSLGGYLSLAFHLAHPTRVAGLVVCDTGPGVRQGGPPARWDALAVARGRGPWPEGLGAPAPPPQRR